MYDAANKLHVYKSSAGSGKTTALTIEYLKLALSSDYAFKHILALTFTNKAAQEMKDRILEYLQKLQILDSTQIIAAPEDEEIPFFIYDIIQGISKYKRALEKYGEEYVLELIKEDSKSLYTRIIHHYSEFTVTTLDSFTNRLIRSFSHDLGLSFNYQVELDSQQLLKDAVDELINRVGKHNDMLTQVLKQFSQQKIDGEKSRRIKNELESRAKSLLNDVEEEYLIPLRELSIEKILKVYKRIIIELKKIENQWQDFGQTFVDLCEMNGIDAKMLYHGKSGILPYFEKLKHKDFNKLTPNSYVFATIEEQKWTSGSATNENKFSIESVSGRLTEIYQQLMTSLSENQSDYLLMIQIKRGIFPYMVLMELEKILDQIKHENQMVHISDFNKIISKEISQETAPYIYERIGNKYQHYLLDEFQDTSVIQWHNLLPLIENSLSENYNNLIVGDTKQAIYRWRGSEVEQFSKLPELIADKKDQLLLQREQILKNNYLELQLNTNYRSGQVIVDFNNQLFQYIKDHAYIDESLLDIYDKHWQVSKDDENKGMAEVRFISLPSKTKRDIYLETYKEITLDIIIDSKKKGYKYKDMAILARNNKDLTELAQFLLAHNIPIVSSESLYVDSSPQVQFMMSLIRYMMHPHEFVYQVEILRYMLEDGRIEGLGLESLTTELATLDAKDELQKYWDLLNIDIDKDYIISLEAYDALETIARAFKVNMNESLSHFFIEASFIFTKEKHQGLSEFILWWELKSKDFKLDIPDDWDAVRLMSFHKVKGLEFPIVVNWFSQTLSPDKTGKSTIWINPLLKQFPEITSFPFTLSALENTAHQDVYDSEMNKSGLDNVNLFYVANTRPTEKLFLLVDSSSKSKSDAKGFQFNTLMNAFVKHANMLEIDEHTFRMGEDLIQKDKTNEKKDDSDVLLLKNNMTSDWNTTMELALDGGELNDMAAWGQKVHLVLAEINTKNDIDMAFRRLVYKGVIDDGEQEIIHELALQVINHPQLLAYYQEDVQVYNERDMVDDQGKIIRPDRLVFVNNLVVVIDYKTGHPKKKDQDQINNYCAQIGNLLKKDVNGYLVYLHEEIMIEEIKKIYNEK